jgi:uncharacterized protein (TIRG00374 family)
MLRFLLGLAFTVASVAFLWWLVDWNTTVGVLKSAHPAYIALAVSSLVLSIFAKTVRWRLLLPSNVPVSTPRLYRILHISFLINNVLPARLGDVARVTMTSRQPGMRLGHVVSSLLTERVTDSVTLVAGFVLVSPLLPLPDAYKPWLHVAWVAVAVVSALFLSIVVFPRQAARAVRSLTFRRSLPLGDRLRQEAASFREGFTQLFSRRRLVPIWGFSGLAWAGAFAINYLLMRALEIDAPITVAILITCTTNLAMLVPSTPGYIGVFHSAAALSLIPFNVADSTAVSFAILAHLVNVVPVSLIGAVFLLSGRESLSLKLSREPLA